MKVIELIDKLMAINPNAEVIIYDKEEDEMSEINLVSVWADEDGQEHAEPHEAKYAILHY